MTDFDEYQVFFPANWAVASVPLAHQVEIKEDLQ